MSISQQQSDVEVTPSPVLAGGSNSNDPPTPEYLQIAKMAVKIVDETGIRY